MHIKSGRQKERHIYTQHIHTDNPNNRHTYLHTYRKTGRQKDRQKERQREIGRQKADTHT
jgi:hypothetical protein